MTTFQPPTIADAERDQAVAEAAVYLFVDRETQRLEQLGDKRALLEFQARLAALGAGEHLNDTEQRAVLEAAAYVAVDLAGWPWLTGYPDTGTADPAMAEYTVACVRRALAADGYPLPAPGAVPGT